MRPPDSFGIEERSKELRVDFQRVTSLAQGLEEAQSYTSRAVIIVIVTGFVGAVWLASSDARRMIVTLNRSDTKIRFVICQQFHPRGYQRNQPTLGGPGRIRSIGAS